MKINVYRNSYFDDNSKEDLEDKIRQEYEDNFEGEYDTDYDEENEDLSESCYFEEETESDFEKQPPKRKKKKRKLRLIWRIVIKLAALFAAMAIIILAAGYVLSFFTPPVTNVLIMATDEDGTRTDTLMLASFAKKTKEISLLSVPRDTYVTVSEENFKLMREDFPQPGSRNMKINAVHHFGGEKYGVELLKEEIANLLDVNVDFYVKVDFDAFVHIIDSIGGIEFDVPVNMSYSDPLQNLYINLQKGPQKLNGEQAEHLLRYRSGYADADLGRIRVQQDFVKAFAEQTVSKGTILSHPGVYLDVMFKYDYIKTDAEFFDAVTYAFLIGGIKTNNIKTQTLPGTPAMRGGQSVYLPKVSEIQDFLPNKTIENKKVR